MQLVHGRSGKDRLSAERALLALVVDGADGKRVNLRGIVAKYELHGIGRNDRFPSDPRESEELSGIPNEVRAPRIVDLDGARCARADDVAGITCIAGIGEDAVVCALVDGTVCLMNFPT